MAATATATATRRQPQTIALLGVTGHTGQVVLRILLAEQQNHHTLKIYARSREKLLQMFPSLADNKRVELYIGSIHDQSLVDSLLSGVDTIISTVGSDGMAPVFINREAAHAIVSSLNRMKKEGDASTEEDRTAVQPLPRRVIWLSSSTKNARFAAARLAFVHWLIQTAFKVGYEDLQGAQDTLMARPDLCSVLWVQPGVLVDEAATGCEISVESVRLAASYEDLGRGFVELATNPSYADLREVGVSSKGGDRAARYAPYMLTRIFRGFLTCYVPFGIHADRLIGYICPWYKM